MDSPTRARRVFVSHSHTDNEFSRRLTQALIDAGLDVWYDERSLGAGYLSQNIERELTRSDSYIVILSPAAVASQWVQTEWYAALELFREGTMRIVPVVAQPCDIPLLLRGMLRVDFTGEPFEPALAKLFRLLGVAGGSPARPLPTVWDEVATTTAHPRGCYCLDWSRDGRFVATGSYDRTVIVWDARTRQKHRTLTGHTQGVDAVAWSARGALASASLGQGIRIWDVASGAEQRKLEGHTGGVTDIAWSPDGAYLLSGSVDQTIRLWEGVTGRCALILRGHTAPVTSVAWSPDGRLLGSTARDATVRVWDTATGALLSTLTGHEGVAYCMRWSPDGRFIASSGNTTVRLWDVQNEELLATLTGHTGHVLRVAWRADGAIIASAGADRMVRLWDAQKRARLAALGGHSDWVHGVAWSPDGGALASCAGAQDGTLRFWQPVNE